MWKKIWKALMFLIKHQSELEDLLKKQKELSYPGHAPHIPLVDTRPEYESLNHPGDF